MIKKILIADDSANERAILTEMLGDGILEAENGEQAVGHLQSATDIDLLLLDIMMPEMDGFEVLAMMNKYHWIDEVPRHHDFGRECVQLHRACL